jgi:hypothetical protein
MVRPVTEKNVRAQKLTTSTFLTVWGPKKDYPGFLNEILVPADSVHHPFSLSLPQPLQHQHEPHSITLKIYDLKSQVWEHGSSSSVQSELTALMMEMELVSEMLDLINPLTRLSTKETFTVNPHILRNIRTNLLNL